MKTVVFYSYKGGTGRTLALANIARFAAGIGKRVIVIDMDLEAPGLTYKLLRDDQRSLSNRGLVGCLLDAIHGADIPPDLGEYLIDVELDERQRTEYGRDGWVKLIPAGNVPSPHYFGELQRLNLDARMPDGGANELMTALLGRLDKDFSPDLVLIDTRTGITSSNTLVLSELADEAFAFFLDMDEQLEGVRMVLRSLAPLTRDPDRPLRLYGVLSRAPTEADHLAYRGAETDRDKERRQRIERFLTQPSPALSYSLNQIDVLTLHHEGSLLNGEYLVLEELLRPERAASSLAWDYANLARTVINDDAAVGSAVAHLASGSDPNAWAEAAVISGNPFLRAMPEMESSPTANAPLGEGGSLRDRIESTRSLGERDPVARARLAALLVEIGAAERAIGNRDKALPPIEEAVGHYEILTGRNLAFAPSLAQAVDQLGTILSEVGRREEGLAQAQRAVTMYEELVARNRDAYLPNLAASVNNLVVGLARAGRLGEAVVEAERAVAMRRELVAASPVYVTALADSLRQIARILREAGREAEAVTAERQAAELTPDGRPSGPAAVR